MARTGSGFLGKVPALALALALALGLCAIRCASPGAHAPASAARADSRPAPPSRSAAAMERASDEFGRGRELALNGDIDCARESFGKALDAVGPGSGALAGDPEILAFSADLYESILRYEALAAPAEDASGEPPPASPLAALETAHASEAEVRAAQTAVSSDAAGAPYDIPIVVNEPVLRAMAEFQNDLHDIISRGLVRSGRYLPMIHRVFAEEGIPGDLAHMALIESSFMPRAISSARAHGLWQFMSRTGKQYGLAANSVVDERSDPEKATRAAARYLKYLHELFNDWDLAMAAYNAGEGKILRAMAKTGSKDFWQLAQTHAIKKQTQTYVPAVLAATLIAKNPLHYGFDLVYEPPLAYEKIMLDRPVSLLALATASQISLEDLQHLNPELKRSITPRQPDGYELKVPVGTRETILAVLPEVPAAKLPAIHRYIVRKGDTLPKIAKRFGVRADELAALNGLAPSTAVKPRRLLEIPEREPRVASARALAKKPQPTATSPKSYRVQGGDTLYAIARRHGTTVEELSAANNLGPSATIKPGDRLTIPIKTR
jgi:membrane-bound lytic murein transglycosylase D